jgi:cell division protein FtsN/nucleoid DNA-binding protein
LQAFLFLTAKMRVLDITPYIRDLILLNECVILRGFGGFDTQYKHASFNKNRKIINPPSKQVTFRPYWIKDNGVLEEYIAGSLKIKSEKASGYIDGYVKDLNSKLNIEGLVFLEGVGKFQKSESKKIIFTSIEDENYLADSFGLDTLEVEIEKAQNTEIEPSELKPIIPAQRKLTGWYIIIGLLLLFILITTFILLSGKNEVSIFSFFSKNDKKPDESEVVIFGQQSKALEDSVIKSIEQTLDKKTSVKNALSLNEQEKSVKPEPSVSYLLIAGSFKSANNADVLRDRLLKKGFNPKIMITGSNYTMVVVGAFKNKNQAFEELNRIRRQLGPSVWLMEK